MEHLLRGGKQVNDDLEKEAEAYGVILPEYLKESPEFCLWQDHLSALELFARCMTQWRAGPGGVIGLDYGVVLEMAKLYQVQPLTEVMEQLQVMEVHARDLLNKR